MSDKELLELAAKAAGSDLAFCEKTGKPALRDMKGGGMFWNPLIDDGDAFRLAVKLMMEFAINSNHAWAQASSPMGGRGVGENIISDPSIAARRSIVRAAAEVGRLMK